MSEAEQTSFEDEVERVARRSAAAWRSPLLMVMIAGLSLYTAWTFREEVAYFFADPTPIQLGSDAPYDLSQAGHNDFVAVGGIHSNVKVGYRQFTSRQMVYFLIGSRVFVREKVPDEVESDGGKGEWPVFEGQGRMLDFAANPEFSMVRKFYEDRAHFDFTAEPSWIILSGVTPRSQWQYPIGVVVLLLVALWNLVLLGRRILGRS